MRETAADIERAASCWAAKLDAEALTPDEAAALDAWSRADPRRAGALARAMAVSSHFDRAAGLGHDYMPASAPPRLDRRTLFTLGGGALAASVAATMGLGLWRRGRDVVTLKGDVRRIALAEGSAITLNTATTVRPALDDRLRRIDLLRGEALFDVARDPERPFVVHAAGVQVQAIGTSFTVRLHDDDRVEVAVTEGVVEVRRPGERPLRLEAERRALVAPVGPVQVAEASGDELDRANAWRNGRLDLSGLTLGEAAAAFARYSDRSILIEDPAVAQLQVAGVFSTSDPEGFARAAALSLGLSLRSTPEGTRLDAAPLS